MSFLVALRIPGLYAATVAAGVLCRPVHSVATYAGERRVQSKQGCNAGKNRRRPEGLRLPDEVFFLNVLGFISADWFASFVLLRVFAGLSEKYSVPGWSLLPYLLALSAVILVNRLSAKNPQTLASPKPSFASILLASISLLAFIFADYFIEFSFITPAQILWVANPSSVSVGALRISPSAFIYLVIAYLELVYWVGMIRPRYGNKLSSAYFGAIQVIGTLTPYAALFQMIAGFLYMSLNCYLYTKVHRIWVLFLPQVALAIYLGILVPVALPNNR